MTIPRYQGTLAFRPVSRCATIPAPQERKTAVLSSCDAWLKSWRHLRGSGYLQNGDLSACACLQACAPEVPRGTCTHAATLGCSYGTQRQSDVSLQSKRPHEETEGVEEAGDVRVDCVVITGL